MESKPSPPEVDRYASEGPGTTTARRWAKDAIDALLLDDPNLDVDPERAAKRSRDALRRVFAMPGSRAGSRAGTSGGRFSATFSKEKVPRSRCYKLWQADAHPDEDDGAHERLFSPWICISRNSCLLSFV
jgi:hypothetical protein